MMTVDSHKDLTAVGRLAGRLGCDVDALLAAAERLNLEPALRVDRVVYFDRQQAALLAKHLSQKES